MAEKSYLVVGPLFDVKAGDRYVRVLNGGTLPPGADPVAVERGLRRELLIETIETGGLPHATVATALTAAEAPVEAHRTRTRDRS